MIDCAIANKAELVIVSRDADYGVEVGKQAFINDHLQQEFRERVSKKRKLLLYTRLSDALKHFKVRVTVRETEEEEEMLRKLGRRVRELAVDNQEAVDDVVASVIKFNEWVAGSLRDSED